MDKGFKLRLAVVFLLISLFCFSVIFRSAQLMLFESEKLSLTLKRQFGTPPIKKIRRGLIKDRNGEPLAVSLDVKSLYAYPEKIKNKKKLAKQISKVLNLSYRKVHKKLNSKKSFIWIKRYLTEDEVKSVQKILSGDRRLYISLGFAEESKRFYPNNSLASHVIGFVGTDSRGLEGLEYLYNKELAGRKKQADSGEGNHLNLTIDKALQHAVENELKETVKKFKAKSGNVVVMDADTGEVWAMASWPTYNLNRFNRVKAEYRRNRSVSETFEPGSTIKSLLVSGAMENKLITEKSKFYCENGKMQIGNNWIRESHESDKWKWLTVTEIMKHSSNIGATKIAFRMERGKYYSWLKKQGLREKTGIDLPGESLGMMKDVRDWSDIRLSNIAFGQGMSITAIQLVRSYATLANGGYLIKPKLVASIENREGRTIKNFIASDNSGSKRVMKESVSKRMQNILTTITQEDGTGVAASIGGFEIAGKTGTSQIAVPGKGYVGGKYVASFIGFAKDVSPNFIVFVGITEPEPPHIYGGTVAAPAFRRILTKAFSRAGVAPVIEKSKTQNILANFKKKMGKGKKKIEISSKKSKIKSTRLKDKYSFVLADLNGISAAEVAKYAQKKKLKLNLSGSGMVVKQIPSAGKILQPGDKIIVKLDRDEIFKQ